MHQYHICYEAPGYALMGDAIVTFTLPLAAIDLDGVRKQIRESYGYSDEVEVVITSIYKFERISDVQSN